MLQATTTKFLTIILLSVAFTAPRKLKAVTKYSQVKTNGYFAFYCLLAVASNVSIRL